jgi:predicted alpha/beta superfamily hydrolase
MRRLARCLALVLSLAAPAAARAQTTRPDGAITIGRVDSIRSGVLNEWRKIWIYTPPSYDDTTYTPQRYPVLYLLDGDAHFHSVTGIIQALGTGVNATYVVPEMIVIAIPNTDRTRDLTPTHTDRGADGKPVPSFKTSGGMPNFLRFIKSELIPHVDSTFRTAPYRVFVGHSLGGIATIDALYTMPETFNAYVAIDPSLWWDDQLLLKQAKKFFTTANLAKRVLYVGQANTLDADDTTANVHHASIMQFDKILGTYNRSGIRYGYAYHHDDSHGSVPLITEYDALRFIFADYQLDLLRALGNPSYVTDHFARISSAFGYEVRPSEQMLDLLGHVGLSLGRDTTSALALLRMNAELYPKSAQVYDGLGDGWMAKGDTAQAIASFEKALAIRPGDAHAKEMLAKLRGKKK